MSLETTPPEAPPAFVPYALEIDGATFTVLEPSQPDAYRVREPSGQVIGLACADSSTVLDAASLAALLASPQTVAAPIPQEVTRRQLWLKLNALGVTRAAGKTQLAGNEAAVIEREEAQAYRRENPLVAMLGASLGLNSAQIDGVFIDAAKL